MLPSDIDENDLTFDFLYHEQLRFVDAVSLLNEKMSSQRLFAIGDVLGLGKAPLAFGIQGDPRFLFTVDNFMAAAMVVKEAGRPWYSDYGSLVHLMTQKKLVPLVRRQPTKEERRNLETALLMDNIGIDARDIVDCQLATRRNILEYPHLGRALGRKTAFLAPDPVAIVPVKTRNSHGKYVSMNVPASLETGFVKYRCDDPATVEMLANRVFDYFTKLTLDIVKPVQGAIAPRGIFRNAVTNMHHDDCLQRFYEAVKLGIVCATAGKLCGDEKGPGSDFVWSALHGSVPSHSMQPPEEVCANILAPLSMLHTNQPFWRGFSHALPVAHIGYGGLNRCKKFLTEPHVTEAHRHVWRNFHLGGIARCLTARGITHETSKREVAETVYSAFSPSPFPRYCNPPHHFLTDFEDIDELDIGGARRLPYTTINID